MRDNISETSYFFWVFPEAFNETLAIVFEKIKEIAQHQDMRGFLWMVAKNRIRTAIRFENKPHFQTTTRTTRYSSDEIVGGGPNSRQVIWQQQRYFWPEQTEGILEELIAAEQMATFLEVLESLPRRHRILINAILSGRPKEQFAKDLLLPRTTFFRHSRNARNFLRDKLISRGF